VVDLYVCVSVHVAFTLPSSKQKKPDLLREKQAADDGNAAMQMGNPCWAVFYSKSEMSQYFASLSFGAALDQFPCLA
jgi:hypothetical protein